MKRTKFLPLFLKSCSWIIFASFVCDVAEIYFNYLISRFNIDPSTDLSCFQISGESDRFHGHSGGDFGPGRGIQSGLVTHLFFRIDVFVCGKGKGLRRLWESMFKLWSSSEQCSRSGILDPVLF
jgi:hypothetical protein